MKRMKKRALYRPLGLLAAYALFEAWVVNARPILISGVPEASYPSSTMLPALCVMPTAMMQLNSHLPGSPLRRCVNGALAGLSAFMVVGRLLSGVHWLADLLGGALLSAGLVALYAALVQLRPFFGSGDR